MAARSHRLSRFAALTALTALALAACGETAAPPAKSAENAAPTSPPAPAAPPAAIAADAAPSPAAPSSEAPAAAPDPAVDGYLFKNKLPVVGAKVSESETKTMDLTIHVADKKAGPKGVEVVKSERESIDKIVEVLAVSADAITKVKVTYKAHSKVEANRGADKTSTSPVSGKTYVVEAKDGVVTVRTEKGAAAPEKEAEDVKDDFKKLGKPNEMQGALPDKPIKIGDKVDSMAQSLRARFAKDDDGKTKTTVENSTITFTSVKDVGGVKLGVFSVKLDLVMDKGDLVIRMMMGGEVELRMDDGSPVSMSFKAPLAVRSPDGAPGPKITGAGVTTMSSTRQSL